MPNYIAEIRLGEIAIFIAFAFGAGVGLWRLIKPLRILAQSLGDLMDDWRGQPARPGVDAKPGVMERLKKLDADITGLRADIGRLVPGSEIASQFERITTELEAVKERQTDHASKLANDYQQINQIETEVATMKNMLSAFLPAPSPATKEGQQQ